MNLSVLIYQGTFTPIASKLKNRLENMNEFFVTTATFHMMYYTDWVPSKDMVFWYGFHQITVVYTMIGLNMIFVIYYCMRGMYFYFYHKTLLTKKAAN